MQPLQVMLETKNLSTTGVFSAKTHNGIKESLVKSCYQKYIRRGMFEQAVYWILQGMLMPAKAKRSNHLNRIWCILIEDISFGEWNLVARTQKTLSKYRNDAVLPDREDLRELIELIYLFCKAKKSRIGSHINAFYTKRESEK